MSAGRTTGVGDVTAALQEQLARLRLAAGQGVYAAANNIMTLAKDNCPVDFGTLIGSGFVTAPVVEGDQVSCEAGFGGPAESYAIHVHERTELHHEIGGAKFLERAIDSERGNVQPMIASFIRGATPDNHKV